MHEIGERPTIWHQRRLFFRSHTFTVPLSSLDARMCATCEFHETSVINALCDPCSTGAGDAVVGSERSLKSTIKT